MTYLSEAARLARLREQLLALGDVPDDPAGAVSWMTRLSERFLGSGLSPEALARLTADDPDWEGFDRFVEGVLPWLRAVCDALRTRRDGRERSR